MIVTYVIDLKIQLCVFSYFIETLNAVSSHNILFDMSYLTYVNISLTDYINLFFAFSN